MYMHLALYKSDCAAASLRSAEIASVRQDVKNDLFQRACALSIRRSTLPIGPIC